MATPPATSAQSREGPSTPAQPVSAVSAAPDQEAARPRRPLSPVMAALAGAAALVPVPVGMVVAHRLGVDALGVLGVAAGVLVASAILRRRGVRWRDLGMGRPRAPGRTFAAALVLALSLQVLTAVLSPLVVAVTHQVPDISHFDVLRGNPRALAAALVAVWTTAAFGEEMLFRGFLVSCLEGFAPPRRARTALAVVLSSAAFGAAHAYQGSTGVVLTGFIGLAYAIVYVRGGRGLWVTILSHGLFDTMSMLALFFSLDRPR